MPEFTTKKKSLFHYGEKKERESGESAQTLTAKVTFLIKKTFEIVTFLLL